MAIAGKLVLDMPFIRSAVLQALTGDGLHEGHINGSLQDTKVWIEGDTVIVQFEGIDMARGKDE